MNNIIIRKAKLEDLSTIQKLSKKLFIYETEVLGDDTFDIDWPYKSGENYFKKAIENKLLLVAIIDDKMVGYISWFTYDNAARKEKKHAEIDNIIVLDEYRNDGVGTRLIEEFKNICKKQEIKYLTVSTNMKNKNTISFYIKNGFEEYEISLKQKI